MVGLRIGIFRRWADQRPSAILILVDEADHEQAEQRILRADLIDGSDGPVVIACPECQQGPESRFLLGRGCAEALLPLFFVLQRKRCGGDRSHGWDVVKYLCVKQIRVAKVLHLDIEARAITEGTIIKRIARHIRLNFAEKTFKRIPIPSVKERLKCLESIAILEEGIRFGSVIPNGFLDQLLRRPLRRIGLRIIVIRPRIDRCAGVVVYLMGQAYEALEGFHLRTRGVSDGRDLFALEHEGCNLFPSEFSIQKVIPIVSYLLVESAGMLVIVSVVKRRVGVIKEGPIGRRIPHHQLRAEVRRRVEVHVKACPSQTRRDEYSAKNSAPRP